MDQVSSFDFEIPGGVVEDLRRRLAQVRWPDHLGGVGWDYGTDLGYLQEICAYWRDRFDFADFVARVNSFPQYTTKLDGLQVSFYHVRSPEPDALPLVLMHGWPSSVAEFLDVIGPLSDPRRHNGNPADAFHLVVPSLPGFGFSGPTTKVGVGARAMASALTELMAGLGYDRYVAQGGDAGAHVAMVLGEVDAAHVPAIHVNLLIVGPPDAQNPFKGLSGEDLDRAKALFAFRAVDAGYYQIQRTRPQTVAYGLNDSPAGLAGWILEKFRAWTDCEGNIESAFSKDKLLTNITIYWVTQTINSSMRYYRELLNPGHEEEPPVPTVPVGYAQFPGEPYGVPIAWARESLDLVHVTRKPRGGHFAAMQVPDIFVDELRSFFRTYR